ncbi:GspE/PulE family protein [Burkholderia territorii]|uniref:GspE/PulE family protein n=1 Tax=Burkholderia territorii TaxID=1503055 RepID=UPI00076C72BC|nr:ATPase, T2SS/T4P/T4SS family [Burkholderia territorii]KVX33869.1 hypothetical protein WT31_09335 [Burkholderia territorii]
MSLFARARKSTKTSFVPDGVDKSRSSDTGLAIRLPLPPVDVQPHVVYPKTANTASAVSALSGLVRDDRLKALTALAKEQGVLLRDLIADEVGETNWADIQAMTTVQIHIDSRYYGNPQFATWVEDVRRLDIPVQVIKATPQELAVARTRYVADPTDEKTDQANLHRARQLLSDCAAVSGSDIHILIREHHTEIQVRVKGDLKTITNDRYQFGAGEGQPFTRAIYTGLSTVKDGGTYNPLQFQNAKIEGSTLPGTGLSSARVIRGPMFPVESGGEFMIIRLQYGSNTGRATGGRAKPALRLAIPEKPPGKLRLAEMGFTDRQMELVERMVRLPMGQVIVTGPTGSGKTTTLFELMRYQAELFPSARQITAEDPPEYPMEWAIQLASSGSRFQEMVRMMLRMDPDTILVGELRAAGEALAAIQAAMTGHFVWSTLHVTDPYKSITRLETLDRDQLSRHVTCDADQLVGLTAQRLVQRLCPHCRVRLASRPDAIPKYMTDALRTWAQPINRSFDEIFIRGDGCEHCDGDAILGKRAVAEIVLTSEAFMEDVLERGITIARRNHRLKPDSDKSMLANVIDRIYDGEVSPLDAHMGVQRIEAYAEGI